MNLQYADFVYLVNVPDNACVETGMHHNVLSSSPEKSGMANQQDFPLC
jgi:hypothetical protein